MNKFDEYRIIPRLMVSIFLWIAADVWVWFKNLDNPSAEHSAALIGVLGVTVGFCKFYMETGNGKNISDT